MPSSETSEVHTNSKNVVLIFLGMKGEKMKYF